MFVGVTALVLGACAVLIWHFIQLIGFNGRVIAAKDTALENYSKTIKNVGVCKSPSGTTYTDEELKKCSPNTLLSDNLSGTLRYNVMVDIAKNPALESVARELQQSCYASSGAVIDFKALYEEAEASEESEDRETKKAYYLDMMKTCSALRAIPDALPAQKNTEALLASLNRLFDVAGWQPKGLSPDTSSTKSAYEGTNSVPVSVSVEANSAETLNVLSTIEKSIRTYDVTSATIEWSGEDTLKLSAAAQAYYVDQESISEKNVTVYGDANKKTSTRKGSSSK